MICCCTNCLPACFAPVGSHCNDDTLTSFHAALQAGCNVILYSVADVSLKALGFDFADASNKK